MVSRPYKCPLCHSAFKVESGMKWHLAHRHEIPAATDALGKDYEDKVTYLREENAQLIEKIDKLEKVLSQTNLAFMQEQGERIKEAATNLQLNNIIKIAAMAIATRDQLIKERLNIDMPDPFEPKG